MKKNYRSTYLANYFKCPKAYEISLTNPIEMSEPMREGLLFEGYVFHFKEGNEDELKGKKQKKTIDSIKAKADAVRPLFLEGEPFKKLTYDCEDYSISGEADYLGEILYKDKPLKCIADLKFTGNLKIWEDKLSELKREDFLQAFIYPYIHYQSSREILPFVYIVVENTMDNPLVRMIKFNPTLQDFGYIIDVIERVNNDEIYAPYVGYGTCVNGKWGRCSFLEHCEHGRKFLCETVELDLSFLN